MNRNIPFSLIFSAYIKKKKVIPFDRYEDISEEQNSEILIENIFPNRNLGRSLIPDYSPITFFSPSLSFPFPPQV